jgi:hypothetical protein
MPRTTARRILVALMVTAVLALLPVQPATAAGLANPLAPASRSVDRLWSWLADLWGDGGVAASRHPAAGRRQPSVLIGKLGGFLDPDGATKLAPTSGATTTH